MSQSSEFESGRFIFLRQLGCTVNPSTQKVWEATSERSNFPNVKTKKKKKEEEGSLKMF
jgi:hypothetical protein